MPQAIADPDDIERFAQSLCTFETDLRTSLTALNGEFVGLSESWQDQEQRKFESEYVDLVHVLEDFCHRIDEHVPYLRQKAVHLRDYLGA